MKDFRRASSGHSAEDVERKLKRRLLALQVVGLPITIFAALAALAYFADEAFLPFLEDRQVALKCLVMAGVVILIESLATGWINVRLSRLRREKHDR